MPQRSPNKLSIYVTLDPRKFLSLAQWLTAHDGRVPATTAETLRVIIDLAYNAISAEFPHIEDVREAIAALEEHYATVTTRNAYNLNLPARPRVRASEQALAHQQVYRDHITSNTYIRAERPTFKQPFSREWFAEQTASFNSRSDADKTHRINFLDNLLKFHRETIDHYPDEYTAMLAAVDNEDVLWEE